MFKNIEVEFMENSLLDKVKSPLKELDFVKKIEINDNILSISYQESEDNICGLSVLSALSLGLCVDYIYCYSKYKNKENEQNVLLQAMTSDIYFANTLLISLLNYFDTNTLLKEKVFFKFNMNGFDKELDGIILDYENENIMLKAKNDIHNILKQNGIKFKEFETLSLKFDENNCFYLDSNNGTTLTPETIYDVLKIDLEFEDNLDDDLAIITFTDLMVSILGTKTLIIPSNCEDIYYTLLDQFKITNRDVKLVVEDV